MHLPLVCRQAFPADAEQISRLFRDEYQVRDRDRPSGYPFPQFFDSEAVADSIKGSLLHWVVAEGEGGLLATTGAVLNVGDGNDHIAEGFGLVVDRVSRRRGIAFELFQFLLSSIRDRVQFFIGETRTANPGGWHVVRRCQFVPIGFEPFAHATPAGMESMLLTGWIPESARRRDPQSFRTSALTRRLASRVLAACERGSTGHWQPAAAVRSRGRSAVAGESSSIVPGSVAGGSTNFIVVRDDTHGERLLANPPHSRPDASGVLRLRRLEGAEQVERFQKQYFVGRDAGDAVCALGVSWDALDRRARIQSLHARTPDAVCFLLGSVIRHLQRAFGDPLTVVLDVRADAHDTQLAVESLGFFPTAYYPCLVASGAVRMDCVQYTWLSGRALRDGWHSVRRLDWEAALDVATAIMGSPNSKND